MTTVDSPAPASSTFPSLHSFSSSSNSNRRRRHQLRPRSTGPANPGSQGATSSLSSPGLPPLDLDDSNQSFLSAFSPHSCASPAPSDASSKLLSAYIDSPIGADPFLIDTSSVPISNVGLYMPQSLGFSPQSHPAGAPLHLQDGAFSDDIRAWAAQPATTLGAAAGVANAAANAHGRQPSTSSIGSTVTSISTYQPSRVADYDKMSSIGGQNFSHNQASTPQHLPTPSSTPTRPAAMNLPSHSQSIDSAVAGSMAMNSSFLGAQQAVADNMVHLMRPTTSSLGPEPPTPMTVVSDYHDEAQSRQADPLMPKLGRSITDTMNDELYFPQPLAVSQAPSASFLVPQNNQIVQNRLHAAHMARSGSGSSNQSAAPINAFKANAPYMQSQLQAMPEGARDPADLHYAVSPHSDSEPKTISPQEALLDHEASAHEIALFPEPSRNFGMYAPPATSASNQAFQTPTTMPFGDANAAAMGAWTSALVQNAMTSAPLQTYGSFAPPPLPASLSSHGIASHSFMAPSPRTMARQTDSTPEFPAPLMSMESSASEAPPSSAASSAAMLSPAKPSTGADTGTYSCTYHGCAQRFSTPQKLQKHKRDVHRANPNVTPGIGSGMSPAQLMERNSQAGPHKCERINPTTGKPCNAIFSRPYDLTRHEDTIHNIRKQKVRCALCTEEKTFSRSDALTRHMRVVHPEVDFPGKHRRRGGRE